MGGKLGHSFIHSFIHLYQAARLIRKKTTKTRDRQQNTELWEKYKHSTSGAAPSMQADPLEYTLPRHLIGLPQSISAQVFGKGRALLPDQVASLIPV